MQAQQSNNKKIMKVIKKKFKIEQVAIESGLTKRTIRYYEDIGMLPAPERTEKGTRLYTTEHVDILNRIAEMKDAMGYSLPDIQKYISLSKTLESYRIDCKNAKDQEKKEKHLKEIIEIINEQLKLIEQKLKKIHSTQHELIQLKKRAELKISEIIEIDVSGSRQAKGK